MKNFYVEIPPLAQSDVDNALRYVAVDLCNPQAAIKLLDEFTECFANLKRFPYSGTELQCNVSLKYSYRWILVDSYIVLYTVNDTQETITIMRVLYGASDYLTILQHTET